MGIDHMIFRWINHWPSEWEPFFWFFSEGNKQWGVRGLFLALAIYLIWNKPTRVATFRGLVAFPVTNALTDAIKFGFPMDRPCAVVARALDGGMARDLAMQFDPDLILRVPHTASSGTASAHAANTMAVAVSLLYAKSPWGWLWLGVSFFTGTSRIYNGVHYPSQVLLGWICGAFVAWVVSTTHAHWVKVRTSRPVAASSDQ
ncbi:MAG: hypothetical protein Fur0036_10600 [Fimbriimonadaceae bacterium]